MFERLANSWELVKASAEVLRADKELIVFPVVSAVASVVVLATFAAPAFLSGLLTPGEVEGEGLPTAAYVVAFLFYVVQYFVIFFCNAALVGAALIRLRGGDPTVADGFRIASQRLGPILGYALVAATVGMVLRAISERSGALGRFVVTMIGLAWGLATYLAVPVLVVEGVGPIEAVKRSTNYLRRTWGEQIAGNLGMGAVFGLLGFGLVAVGIVALIAAAATGSVALIVIVAGLLVLSLVLLALVSSALGGVYAAAVYRYAEEGKTDGYFDAALVQHAFRAK